jgi:hypothetical protein
MRRIWRLLAFVWICSIAVDATPALAAIPPGRLAIGDSVMLGAREELRARGMRVNAVVSRQFRDAVPLVEQLKAAGTLPSEGDHPPRQQWDPHRRGRL